MLPAEIAYRHCAQQPGEPCVTWDVPLPEQYMVDGKAGFHEERWLDADSQAVAGANVSKEEFAKAVFDSGLIV